MEREIPAEYVPTADQRALVENAAAFGLTQADSAEQLKIDEKTLREHLMQDYLPGGFAAGCSTWPPNLKRIADRSLSPKLWSCRERKRSKREAARTLAGTASSTAASTVQRPSPESSTSPEKFASAESS